MEYLVIRGSAIMSAKQFLNIFIMISLLAVSGCGSEEGAGSTDGDSDKTVTDGDDPIVDGDTSDGDVNGDIDQETVDPWMPNTCEDANKTTCADDGDGSAICSCDDGYEDYGDAACMPSNPCLIDTVCAADLRVCENNQGVAACGNCLGGYHDESGSCVEDVVCGDNTCNGHGNCTDDTGVPVCACTTGYAGDHCENCDDDNGWHMNAAGDVCTTDPCDPNPCNYDDHRVCEAGTGNCLCDTGFCDIDGACVPDDTENPDHDCSVCDSAANKNDWSPRADDYECRASAGVCDVAEVCDGTSNDCPEEAKATIDTPCDDDTMCNGRETCDGLGACRPGTAVVCNDDQSCTDDSCNPEDGSCLYDIQDATCLIAGNCYAHQDDDPANECQWCLWEQSQTAWTYKANGSSCSSDGLDCSDDICSGAGSCIHNANDAGCLIGGQCYAASENNPANECQWCVMAQSNTAWTNKTNGFACTADDNPCTDDICSGAGSCTHPANDDPCNDDVDCTDNDVCEGGTCSGTSYSCHDNGDCNSGDDYCTCLEGYTGDYCEACTVSYSGYPNCLPATTPEFVTIPAGLFWMGCSPGDEECWSNESPGHEVTVSAFEIMETEVTNAQYVEFLNVNGNLCDGSNECVDSASSDCRLSESDGVWSVDSGYDVHPLVEVTWYGAKAFCEWLGAVCRQKPNLNMREELGRQRNSTAAMMQAVLMISHGMI